MSTRKMVAIYGAGLLGQQVLHHLKCYQADDVSVVGFIDDTKPAELPVSKGHTTLGSLEAVCEEPKTAPGRMDVVFAIGYTSMLARRAALDRLTGCGYDLHTVVHPRAIIEPGAHCGAGSIVLAGAILDQEVSIGAACFIDIGVRLGAGTSVGCNNYLSSGTSTGSRVSIGDNCFFGMDCTVTTDVVMGDNLFVNAKTLVPRDIGDNVKLVELHKYRELPQPTESAS